MSVSLNSLRKGILKLGGRRVVYLLSLGLAVGATGCGGLTSSVTTPPPSTPSLSISNIAAGSISTTSATITWTTNVVASSQVDYGTTSSYGQSTALDSTLVTSHSQALNGLSPDTLYHFRVRSTDADNNTVSSPDQTFRTAASTAVTISNVQAQNITSSSASITWTTNVAASSQVEYGTTASYGQSTTVDSTLVTSHSQVLSGLSPATLYHFRVRSTDANSAEGVSGDFTFTTAAAPGGPDTTPPAISAVNSSPDSSQARITWTTDEPADTQVEYGTTTSYGQSTTVSSTLVTSHSQIIFNVSTSTLYHYRVKSRDAAGNLATSQDFTFTTTATTSPTSVTLTVREPVGTTRNAEAISTGVPFPGGTDPANLALFDSSGTEVPVQVTQMQGNVPWFLVDFQADLAAGGTKTFTLQKTAPAAFPTPAVTKTETASSVTVSTGPLEVTFSKSPFDLFDQVRLNGTVVASSTGSNIRLVDHNGTTFFGNSAAPTRFETEVDGPLRVTYRIDGDFTGYSGMGYTIRITFYAGKTTVRVEYLIRNSLQAQQRHAHLRDAEVQIGGGSLATVRATGKGTFVGAGFAGSSSGLVLSLETQSENDNNNGFVLPDWSYRGATFLVDFSNPASMANQVDAAKSPLMALAPASWYSQHGDMSTKDFASIQDEKDTYTAWGLSWSASQVPSDPPKPNYSIGWENIAVHDDLEADDLWQHLLMYIRGEGQEYGFFHRARAWSRYFKREYAHRTDGFEYKWDGNFENQSDLAGRSPTQCLGCTSSDNSVINGSYETGKVDSRGATDFGADHIFGFGLADWYHLTGDTGALEALTDLGEVAQRMVDHRSSGYPVALFGLRGPSRQLLILQRVWEMTGNLTWQSRRDHVATLFQNSSDWDATYGMFMTTTDGNPEGCSNRVADVNMFQPLWAAWGLYRYYLDTGSSWARTRLINMGNFADTYATDPNDGLSASRMWFDCDAPGDIRYPNNNGGYTVATTDLSTIAFRLDGDGARLDAARQRWTVGMCSIFSGSPGTVCEFINGRFLSGDTFYFNNGYLSNGQLLFHDAPLP